MEHMPCILQANEVSVLARRQLQRGFRGKRKWEQRGLWALILCFLRLGWLRRTCQLRIPGPGAGPQLHNAFGKIRNVRCLLRRALALPAFNLPGEQY